MSNPLSIADVILKANGGQPITLGFPSIVGHFPFSIGNPIADTPGVAAAVLTIPNPMQTIDAAVEFPSRSANALPFILRTAGTATLGRGVEYQIDINLGTGITPAIATTGLQTTPLGSGLYNDNWLLEVQGMWDPTSLNLRGIQYGWAGGTAVAQSAIVGSAPAALANLQFTCAVTLLNSNASNTFTLTDFSAEYI